IDAKDATGATPWMQAALAGNIPLMKWLKNQGADVHTADTLGRTALMRVLDHNPSKEVLSHLIDVTGIDPKLTDKAGLTAFGHALRAGDRTLGVASFLIDIF